MWKPLHWAAAIIIAVGIGLRFVQTPRPLWLDETWTGAIAAQNSLQAVVHQIYNDVNAPLYYLLIHVWSIFFGISNEALCLPSCSTKNRSKRCFDLLRAGCALDSGDCLFRRSPLLWSPLCAQHGRDNRLCRFVPQAKLRSCGIMGFPQHADDPHPLIMRPFWYSAKGPVISSFIDQKHCVPGRHWWFFFQHSRGLAVMHHASLNLLIWMSLGIHRSVFMSCFWLSALSPLTRSPSRSCSNGQPGDHRRQKTKTPLFLKCFGSSLPLRWGQRLSLLSAC